MAKREQLSFSHAIEIAAAPEAVWRALTDGEFTRQYWAGRRVESRWKVGSPVIFWYQTDGGEAISDRGIVVECAKPRRLSYTWHVEFVDEMRDAHPSRVTFDLAAKDDATTLTLTHDGFEPGSKVLEAVRQGWPAILESLKSLLETGTALEAAAPDSSDAAA
ncbi:MAG: SRPBCC family protein [Dongiaceae bacterium]